jgi:AbrB family looped-hinge helix DNA binding protein
MDRPPKIYGTITLNEKGQAVIPAEARNALGLEAGSKLVVLGGPDSRTLVMITSEHAEEMLANLTAHIQAIRSISDKSNEGDSI